MLSGARWEEKQVASRYWTRKSTKVYRHIMYCQVHELIQWQLEGASDVAKAPLRPLWRLASSYWQLHYGNIRREAVAEKPRKLLAQTLPECGRRIVGPLAKRPREALLVAEPDGKSNLFNGARGATQQVDGLLAPHIVLQLLQ